MRIAVLIADLSITAGYVVMGSLFATVPLRAPAGMTIFGRNPVTTARLAAVAFFVFCGLTHLHRAEHNLTTPGGGEFASVHQLVVHAPQAVSVWVVVIVLSKLSRASR